jgi:hypothetical protein
MLQQTGCAYRVKRCHFLGVCFVMDLVVATGSKEHLQLDVRCSVFNTCSRRDLGVKGAPASV